MRTEPDRREDRTGRLEETYGFAGLNQVLLDEGQHDGDQGLLEDPLPHRAAVVVKLLQEEEVRGQRSVNLRCASPG